MTLNLSEARDILGSGACSMTDAEVLCLRNRLYALAGLALDSLHRTAAASRSDGHSQEGSP